MGEGLRSVLCLYVTVLGEILDDSIVGKLARLGETVHAFVGFDENMSVVNEGLELILLCMMQAGMTMTGFTFIQHGHGGIQVEVFHTNRHAFCIRSRLDTVEEVLGCNNVGGGSTNVSWVLDDIAANGEVDAFGFGLLWSYFGNDAQIGGALSHW